MSTAPEAAVATLGRYQLHRLIGAGGMAEVYLALDTGALGLDRWVAIKRVLQDLSPDPRFVTMLLDEARLAARIAHPNVAQVIDLGEQDGSPYIVMEYLRGHSLSALSERARAAGRRPKLELMARVVADACEGAHAAHELRGLDGVSLGLVHRDLSPHNIFVTTDGAVKVMDFGIAKALGRLTRTAPGTRKGKYSYMSPEQIRGEPLDRRSDIYALGLVLYELTAGRAVYEGMSALESEGRAPITPPSKLMRGYPKPLERIVMRALEQDPAQRHATARELSQALERFLVERRVPTGPAEIAAGVQELFPEGPSAPNGSGAEPTPGPGRRTETRMAPAAAPRAQRRRRVRLYGLAAAGVALAGGAWLWSLRAEEAGMAEAREQPALPDPRDREAVSAAQTATAAVVPAPPSSAPVAPPEAAEVSTRPLPVPAARVEKRPQREAKSSRAARRARPPPEARSDLPGTLDLRSTPWAEVWIDGQPADTTPLVGAKLSPGTHQLRLRTEDGREKRTRVKIEPGKPSRMDVRF